ncbi:MAG TPA: DinB family protein [Acidimicrobiales bacterium]|nr:DinB family protein [Acidimicrobiales bacterium]
MTVPDGCEECGFVYDSVGGDDAPAAIRAFARRFRAPLTRFLPGEDGDALVRRRPAPDTWSALEYAAHVRDVFGNYDRWVHQTLAEDRPVLEGPGPDELAASGNYNDLDPVTVADELAANADRLAATFEAVPDDGWDRVGLRRDEERSVLLTARRAVHEGNHHLLDTGRGLRAVREQAKQA